MGELLHRHAIRYTIINGSLSLLERLKVLRDFRSPIGTNILLMTLGTGAVGWAVFHTGHTESFYRSLIGYRLNLAIASRIYLLEPQWNPSIESQAIGRALRLGQTDHVVIIRYIMRNTVEEVRD